MAEMKVEHTAEGREIVYRVYVHPEMFNWLTMEELIKKLSGQFENHLDEVLGVMKDEQQA